jgi:hypothetical protein
MYGAGSVVFQVEQLGVFMKLRIFSAFLASLLLAPNAWAGFITFEAAGINAFEITSTRDAFRAAVGGGTVAGANGSFGGLRREINWDGVPDAQADPNNLAANFFNVNSPRGVVLNTPGTGFMVSANAGGISPVLFGFASDFQAFSAQRLFTAVNSNITDVRFFMPGTNDAATTSAFGMIFVDVEVANQTRIQFFDENDALIFSRDALVAGNQGLSFVGAVAGAGEKISRVRITSGMNTIVSNGVLGNPFDDVVVMDDFLYAEPLQDITVPIPEPSSIVLLGLGLLCIVAISRRRDAIVIRLSPLPLAWARIGDGHHIA